MTSSTCITSAGGVSCAISFAQGAREARSMTCVAMQARRESVHIAISEPPACDCASGRPRANSSSVTADCARLAKRRAISDEVEGGWRSPSAIALMASVESCLCRIARALMSVIGQGEFANKRQAVLQSGRPVRIDNRFIDDCAAGIGERDQMCPRDCRYPPTRCISVRADAGRVSHTSCRNGRENAPFGPLSRASPRSAQVYREFPTSRNRAPRRPTADRDQYSWAMSGERRLAWDPPENCPAEACCLPR